MDYKYERVRRFEDLKGNKVERTPRDYPYSYDAYVVWKSEDYNPDKIYSVVYSDRLMDWDLKKFSICCKEIWNNMGQYFDKRSPEDIQRFLSMYYDSQIKLIAIEKGCNVSSGYPYWIFHFEEIDSNK